MPGQYIGTSENLKYTHLNVWPFKIRMLLHICILAYFPLPEVLLAMAFSPSIHSKRRKMSEGSSKDIRLRVGLDTTEIRLRYSSTMEKVALYQLQIGSIILYRFCSIKYLQSYNPVTRVRKAPEERNICSNSNTHPSPGSSVGARYLLLYL